MSDGEDSKVDRVFIVSIRSTEIVFCPRANRIVSRFKSEPAHTAGRDQGDSSAEPENT